MNKRKKNYFENCFLLPLISYRLKLKNLKMNKKKENGHSRAKVMIPVSTLLCYHQESVWELHQDLSPSTVIHNQVLDLAKVEFSNE